MQRKQYYIAYGSNLNTRQMAFRCPEAEMVGTGVLNGYELQFRGRTNSAYATVKEQENGKVPVLLWKLSASDEARLDQYEGYPFHYGKRTASVEIEGEVYQAMLYEMQPGFKQNLPSAEYYRTILEGYENLHLPVSVLHDAIRASITAVREENLQEPELKL